MTWLGWTVGMSGPTVQAAKRRLKKLYSYAKGLDDSEDFGANLKAVLQIYQPRRNAEGWQPPLRTDGILDYNTQDSLGMIAHAKRTHMCFSVGGAGSAWNLGYQFDLGEALDRAHWTHQGIGYPAAPFPMRPSITAGETEFARQLALWGCEKRTWGFVSYSEGAIVTADIMDRCGITPSKTPTDLARFASTFIGGATWGNPRREQGHTCPGGIDPSGHGIVTPNTVNTPPSVWDFAAGKHMAGSTGQDLYTTCGYDGDPHSVADEEAIWAIVDKGTLGSALPLLQQVLQLLPTPLQAGKGAVLAILDALDFFVLHGLTPHTSYQFVQPIAGDGRDSWRLALDHLNQLGAATPVL